MNVEQRIENDRLNLKITLLEHNLLEWNRSQITDRNRIQLLETSLKNLAIAGRHLATEADEWLNHTNNRVSGVLEDAIDKVNDLASGIQ